MLHANNDLSGVEDEARRVEVQAGLNDYPFLAVGEEAGFSWSPCEACGSRLGGDRVWAWVLR